MMTYEELKTALMDSQNVKNKKDKNYKEKERQVEQCVQMELAIQREIEESIKNDNLLMAEISKKQEQLNKLVTEKYQLIYADEIEKLKEKKEIVDAAQKNFDYAVNLKEKSNNVMEHTCTLGETCYSANEEYAILQLTQQLFQQAKVDIEVHYTNRPAVWVDTKSEEGMSGGYVYATTNEPRYLTFREKVDSKVQQQAEKKMTADQFAQLVLNTQNTEKIVEWICGLVEANLNQLDRSQNVKFIDFKFVIKVYEKEVNVESIGFSIGIYTFSEHNMQLLYGREMCDGLAKALAIMTRISIIENHELADVQMYPVEGGYNIVYHEMNPDYAGMTGWGE